MGHREWVLCPYLGSACSSQQRAAAGTRSMRRHQVESSQVSNTDFDINQIMGW